MEIIWIALVFLLNGTKNYIATKLFMNKNNLLRHNYIIHALFFVNENRMSHMDHGIFQKPPDNSIVVISSGYQEVLENSVVPAIPDQQNTLLKRVLCLIKITL